MMTLTLTADQRACRKRALDVIGHERSYVRRRTRAAAAVGRASQHAAPEHAEGVAAAYRALALTSSDSSYEMGRAEAWESEAGMHAPAAPSCGDRGCAACGPHRPLS